MPYANTREIKDDVLRRAGESISASPYNDQVIIYINRVYRTLCAGASEFLPEFVDDWWWMRSTGILTLAPVIQTGTVTVTKDSTAITFSSAPASSVSGYVLKVQGHSEVFSISSHTGGQAAATLDSAYTGETATSPYMLMKVTYSLSSNVNSLISPMIGFRNNPKIYGVSPERMDTLYPLSSISAGAPTLFSLETDKIVRFSHGGLTNGQSMRVEYRYRKELTDLTDSTSSIPLIPLEWRHLLADMALTYLLLEKNDDRSNAIALSARTGLAAMLRINRRELTKIGGEFMGRIFPRQSELSSRVLKTDSGLIIG